MKSKHYLAMIALAGAALLFWRLGQAIVAEMHFEDPRATEARYIVSTTATFVFATLLPIAILGSVVACFREPTQKRAIRLALASSVGIYFITPTLLRIVGFPLDRTSSFLPWLIVAFLTYRFLFKPAAMRADYH